MNMVYRGNYQWKLISKIFVFSTVLDRGKVLSAGQNDDFEVKNTEIDIYNKYGNY